MAKIRPPTSSNWRQLGSKLRAWTKLVLGDMEKLLLHDGAGIATGERSQIGPSRSRCAPSYVLKWPIEEAEYPLTGSRP